MKERIRKFIDRTPFLRGMASQTYSKILTRRQPLDTFPGSGAYWEKRYSEGSHSGSGSYSFLAKFKAEVLNAFVAKHGVPSVIEFGCGDGNQLTLAEYPAYLGFDVSATAIAKCKSLFEPDGSKSFRLNDEYDGETAELVLSLDVIYHLVEDDVFERYMRMLFAASSKYVIIYSSNFEDHSGHVSAHVRHRKFTTWVAENARGWKLVEHLPNRYPYDEESQQGSHAEFFMFESGN